MEADVYLLYYSMEGNEAAKFAFAIGNVYILIILFAMPIPPSGLSFWICLIWLSYLIFMMT